MAQKTIEGKDVEMPRMKSGGNLSSFTAPKWKMDDCLNMDIVIKDVEFGETEKYGGHATMLCERNNEEGQIFTTSAPIRDALAEMADKGMFPVVTAFKKRKSEAGYYYYYCE